MVKSSPRVFVALAFATCLPGCLADKLSLEAMVAASADADAGFGGLAGLDVGVAVDAAAVADDGVGADVSVEGASDGGDANDAGIELSVDVDDSGDTATADAPDAVTPPDVGDTVNTVDALDTVSLPDATDAGGVADAADVAPAACKEGVGCDDGNACTSGDVCVAGKCAGKALNCDDKLVCTDDACDKATGCTHVHNTAKCDDGNPCTPSDACVGGLCIGSGVSVFNATFGGATSDHAYAVAALSDGGLVLAGMTDSTDLPGGKETAGGADAWLVRTSANGKLMWNQTYGGSGFEYARALAVLADGGWMLAGITNSLDLPGGQKSAGDYDIWIVRTDAGGKLLWNQTYGGSGTEHANALAVLTDGGLALAGPTNSSDLPGGQKTAGGTDFWLVRTDAGGKLLWHQTYGGSSHDDARALTALQDGGLVAAGYTYSTGLPGGQKSAGGQDLWLVRTDATGKLLWNQTYGGSGDDTANALVGLADGGFGIAGQTNSTDLPGGQKSAGSVDFWLVRVDASGKLLWNRTYGGSGGNEGAYALAALQDGGLALAGNTGSSNLPGGQKIAGIEDFWLVRTDQEGNLLWNRTYGGSDSDYANALTPLADGGLALAGMTKSSNLPGGQKTAGNYDFWLVRADAWGNASCATSGGCVSKPLASCDDANPCTADLCSAEKSCHHTTFPDATPCNPGKACKAGACGP